MKKKIISVILGLFLFFNFSTDSYAQNCATACQNPGSVDCLRCTNLQNNNNQQNGNSENGSQQSGSGASIHGECGENGIDTAIGCLDVLGSQEEFLGDLLRWAIGVGGGIAFLLIVYAGFMIMTSSGNPDRLKAGQELLTSAISGLILLIFSVFILNLLGVKILEIPGFGGLN